MTFRLRLHSLYVLFAVRVFGDFVLIRTRGVLRAGERHGAVLDHNVGGEQRERHMGRLWHQLSATYGMCIWTVLSVVNVWLLIIANELILWSLGPRSMWWVCMARMVPSPNVIWVPALQRALRLFLRRPNKQTSWTWTRRSSRTALSTR